MIQSLAYWCRERKSVNWPLPFNWKGNLHKFGFFHIDYGMSREPFRLTILILNPSVLLERAACHWKLFRNTLVFPQVPQLPLSSVFAFFPSRWHMWPRGPFCFWKGPFTSLSLSHPSILSEILVWVFLKAPWPASDARHQRSLLQGHPALSLCSAFASPSRRSWSKCHKYSHTLRENTLWL